MWLSNHPEVEDYIIFDDEIVEGLEAKQILCKHSSGFGLDEYDAAVSMVNSREKSPT